MNIYAQMSKTLAIINRSLRQTGTHTENEKRLWTFDSDQPPAKSICMTGFVIYVSYTHSKDGGAPIVTLVPFYLVVVYSLKCLN